MNYDNEPGVCGELRNDRFVGKTDLTASRTRWGNRRTLTAQWLSTVIGPHAALILILLIGA